jgi:amidohydrolase
LFKRSGKLLREIKKLFPAILAISHDIHQRPELGNHEYYAQERITGYLEKEGFRVEKNVASLPTAFVAYRGNRSGPCLGYVAEYDALPEIGHGCGHNLICAASVGAAVALSRVTTDLRGEIRILGTPAEETTGGKVAMLQKGFFNDLAAVMMFHPGVSNVVNFSSLALEALEIVFHGKMGHAAIDYAARGDTLEALLQFFFWVKGWKKTLPELCQVQGIIKDGGSVPNIRPAKTVARFYLRAPDEKTLDGLVLRFREEARKIAQFTGTKVEINAFESRYQPFKSNETLAKVFVQALRRLNVNCSSKHCQGTGSMDMGNVSHLLPAIHPYLTLEGGPGMLHTAEFARAAGGKWGDDLLLLAVQALALTGLEVMTNEGLRKRIREEHQQKESPKGLTISL